MKFRTAYAALVAFIASFAFVQNAFAYVVQRGYYGGYGYGYRPPVVVYPHYYVYGYHPVVVYGGGFVGFVLFILFLVFIISLIGRR